MNTGHNLGARFVRKPEKRGGGNIGSERQARQTAEVRRMVVLPDLRETITIGKRNKKFLSNNPVAMEQVNERNATRSSPEDLFLRGSQTKKQRPFP